MDFTSIQPFVRYARYLSVSRANLPPSPVIPCDARLFYGMEGEGYVEAAGETYRMKKGSLLILNPGVQYRYCVATPEERITYIVLNFDYTKEAAQQKIPVPPKAPGDFTANDLLTVSHFGDVPELSGAVFLEGMHRLSGKLAEIVREYAMNIIFNETRISGLLSDVLVDCVRRLRLNTVENAGKIDGILAYIHENFRQSITNGQLGELFHFHPNYISALIKKYTGMPLHKYLNHVRIAHALEMLDGGEPSLGEMAAECGYCDIYYFSRSFKSTVGLSPAEYRRRK